MALVCKYDFNRSYMSFTIVESSSVQSSLALLAFLKTRKTFFLAGNVFLFNP